MAAFSTPITVTDVKTGIQFNLGAGQLVKVLSSNLAFGMPFAFPASSTLTTNNITAHAGGGQQTGSLLSTEFNSVSTVATAADSLTLPAATLYTQYVIFNGGANALAIFPYTSGTINGGSANASISLAAGASIILVASSTTNWNTTYPSLVYYLDNRATLARAIVYEDAGIITYNSQMLIQVTAQTNNTALNPTFANLYINPNRIMKYAPKSQVLSGPSSITANNITAHAGGGQQTSGASLLVATNTYNNVTVVATAADSVTLPAASVGGYMVVQNLGVNSLSIYAFTSGTIDGGSANGFITLAPGAQRIFTGTSTTAWTSSSPVVTELIYNSEQDADEVYLLTNSVSSLATAIDLIIAGEGGLTPTLTGTNAFTGNNSFSSPISVDAILPFTANGGTSLKSNVIPGTAYASPTVLTALQSGAICLLNAAAGNVFTLPSATAANIGVTFTFIQTATVTSNFATIQGASSSDLFVAGGNIRQLKGTATPTIADYSPNGSSNYQVKTNGTTTGGIIGDMYTVVCTGLNAWQVNGTQSASGTVATPFAG